ncbi:MAG: hypothetical protein KDB62_08720 [Solirubrobacterales bacterium]|nr:hypothetical protein [Solirubrobacterales bacterium]
MRFLPRPTYANVVATLAIFIALGGISYAATNLGKNSVGTKQIKKKAVTTPKIRKDAVTAPKLRKDAVATPKIRKDAVTGAKIKQDAVGTSKLANGAVTQGKVDPNLLASIDSEAQLKVLNGDGSVLGTLAGVLPSGIPIFQVIIDGGIYTYLPSGQVYPFTGPSPAYKNNACSGTAYVEADDQAEADLLFANLAGGPSRITYRTTAGGNLGPVSAWQFTKTTENVVGQNLWERDDTGACVPTSSSPFTGVLIALDPVTAPPEGIAPLTIG